MSNDSSENNYKYEGIYTNDESVQDSTVSDSITQSIKNIMSDNNLIIEEYQLRELISEDCILDDEVKDYVKKLMRDDNGSDDSEYRHSSGYLFTEVLLYVWNRIVIHDDCDELKQIFNEEMTRANGRCINGRMGRMVSVLCGFFDDVCVDISEKEQICGTILAVGKRLEDEDRYERSLHISIAREELLEKGCSRYEINEWLEHV